MKIELEVSTKNEFTSSPWWVIVNPRQQMATKTQQALHEIAGMITGPFFSREEATERLNTARHHYGPNAHVYCMSGCFARQYDRAYREAAGTEAEG